MSRLQKNFIYTVASGLAPILVTIVTIPIYLRVIGDQRYGMMAIVWLLTGYFSFFEMGMGRALTQRLAKMKDALAADRAGVVVTALTVSSLLALLGGSMVGVTAWFYLPTIDFDDPLIRGEAIRSTPMIALAFVPVVLANVMSGVLQAQERFAGLAVIRVITTLAMQLLPLFAALLLEPKIEYLVAATVLARFLTLFMSSALLRRELLEASRSRVQWPIAKDLLSFGGWVSAAGIIGPLLVFSDRFLIGSLVGAAAVTYYTIPYNLAMRLAVIPSSLATVIFPKMSYLSEESRKLLAEKSIGAIQFALTPMIVALMLTLETVLKLWLGAETAERSTLVGQVILVGVWANCIARVPFAELQATGRPAVLVKWMLWQMAPYLVALYFSLKYFGLVGASVVWSVRVFIDTIGLFQIAAPESRYLALNAGYGIVLAAAFMLVTTTSVKSSSYWILASLIMFTSIFYSVHRAPVAIKRLPVVGRFF